MWRLLLLGLVACGGPSVAPVQSPPTNTTCRPQPPIGDPSQSVLRTLPGFTISPPQTCPAGSYIRIERMSGTRVVGTGRMPGGGFAEGCTDLSDPVACKDAINAAALLQQAGLELQREHIETASLGAGPCAPDTNGDYSGWNFATGVHDWKHVDRLIAKIAELMDRYDVRGYVGASVYTIPCVTLL